MPTWNFDFDEEDKKKYVKEYRYLDTVDDKTYDFLRHLRVVLNFNKTTQKTWQPSPIDKINFKLIDNDTKIAVRLDTSQDLNFKKYMYEWDNTIMIYSYFNRKWYKSSSRWITIVHRLLYGIWVVDKKAVNELIRDDVANYFLEEKDALVIAHVKNFEKMNNDKKSLVSFIIMSDGYLRVNFNGERILYVGASSNLHKNFCKNFLSKCARPVLWALASSMRNLQKDLGRVPFTRVYRYRIISTFNRDDYWFDENAFKMTLSLTLVKRIKVADNNIIQSTKGFVGLDYTKTLTADEIKTIKKYNRFDEEVANANLNNVVTASQNSYFLYDNQNIIRETFISELQKQVYLIGGISFFDKVDKSSKMFLIEPIDKMKFDVRKNKQISYFDFNLCPTRASETISYIKKEINNIMIIATEKLSKVGQK